MKGNFSEILSASATWTRTVLFKPFIFKKWLMFYIIALFAFQMHGGCNINANLPGKSTAKKIQTERSGTGDRYKQNVGFKQAMVQFKAFFGKYTKISPLVLVSGAIGLFLVFLLLLQWLFSVFSFVFIESIVKNDASLKVPFRNNKPLGNSYFGWNIGYTLVMVLIFAILGKLGYDSLVGTGVFATESNPPFGLIALTVLPYILIAIFFVVASSLVGFFISDCVLVIMYKEKLSILHAMPSAFRLLSGEVAAFVKYFFIKMGLWIVMSIIKSILSFSIILIILIPAGILAIFVYAFNRSLPVGVQPLFAVIWIALGICFFFILVFFINAVFLPFTVFFKTFNLKFISRLDERYNLFRLAF